VLITTLLVACAVPTTPPTSTPNVGTVADQLTRGAPLYAQSCATANCHGTRGEGIRAGDSFSAWPLVGKEFQARNPNAQVVFDVVRSGDEQNLRAMTDQQIYDAIAFELNLNEVPLSAPLTAQIAATTPSGGVGFNPATIYPPLDNLKYLTPPTPPRASYFSSNDYVALRIDQLTQVSSIGDVTLPDSGKFVLMVFALKDLTNHPLDIDPQYLQFYDSADRASTPAAIAVNSPIEQFHRITIQPDHGTAAIAVFPLAPNVSPDKLVYDDATSHALTLSLK
jgi:hypothetical protein